MPTVAIQRQTPILVWNTARSPCNTTPDWCIHTNQQLQKHTYVNSYCSWSVDLFQIRVYRKVYVSLSEAVFLVNLLFLLTSALYTSSIDQVDKQKYFTGVLVGMAFIHFVGIVVFSTVRHCYQVCARHYRELPLLASSRVSVNESDSNNLSYQQYRSDIKILNIHFYICVHRSNICTLCILIHTYIYTLILILLVYKS